MCRWSRRCISLATSISRIAEPESSPTAARTRRRRLASRPVGMAVTAAIAAASFVVVSRSSVFHVRDVEVTGIHHLSRAAVIRLSGITGSSNVLWIDAGGVERRLETEPWIASADVRTSLPDGVEISVVERTPVAIVRTSSGRRLVAADGTVLGMAGSQRLPTIHLPRDATRLDTPFTLSAPSRVVGAISASGGPALRTVDVGADGTLTIELAAGPEIRFGAATQVRAKASAIRGLLAWASTSGSRLRSLDVVSPSAPAVTLAG
jgi:cell division protein FtsQ